MLASRAMRAAGRPEALADDAPDARIDAIDVLKAAAIVTVVYIHGAGDPFDQSDNRQMVWNFFRAF